MSENNEFVPGQEPVVTEPVLEITEPVVAPVETVTVVEPVQVVEKTYTYQPTDDMGRKLGGVQVIKYTDQDDLVAKLANQNTLLVRRLREETKRNRLGLKDEESIPDEAPRVAQALEFNPRTLSADERIQLSRDLIDPERLEEARDTLFETTFGVKPAEFSRTLDEVRRDNIRLNAKIEADAFVQSNPDYYRCAENFEAITGWMTRYNLSPVRENFKRAYDKLKDAGVLIESGAPTPKVETPAPAPTPEPIEIPTEPVPVVEEPKPEPRRPAAIPTGITREQTGSEGHIPTRAAGSDIVYEYTKPDGSKVRYTGAAAVDMMPPDEFKRRLNSEPGFRKKVDAL